MLSDKPFTIFSSEEDNLDYLKRYNFLTKTKKTVPTFFINLHDDEILKCSIIGYETNYDTFSVTVIDYGDGPYFIHSDYLKDKLVSTKKTAKRLKGDLLLEIIPSSYIVFDLETTDLNIYKAEIIEISAIKIINGEVLETFSELIKPTKPIPKRITKITGITDLDVYSARSVNDVLKDFLNFIGDHILVGYNIHSYDTNILYDAVTKLYNRNLDNDYIDVYHFARKHIDKEEALIPNYKLTTICDFFNIDSSNAHRALSDCYMCDACYQSIIMHYTNTPNTPQTKQLVTVETINEVTDNFEECLVNLLLDIINEKELPSNSIYLLSNVSTKGVLAGVTTSKSIIIYEPPYPYIPSKVLDQNVSVLNISQDDEYIYLSISTRHIDSIPIPSTATLKPTKSQKYSFRIVIFNQGDRVIYDFIKSHILYRLKTYQSSSSFGCCSKFNACSDALKCVHENKLYSTGCQYRTHLDNGAIFYGKNKNVNT